MILGTGVSMAPMQEVQAEEPEPTLEDQLQEEKNNAKASFQDWKINNLKENDNRTGKIDEIIIAAESKIDRLTTIEGVQECRDNAILEMNNIVKDYEKLGKRKRQKDDNHLNKHAMHLIRLFMMAIDILERGEIRTRRRVEAFVESVNRRALEV